MELKRTILAVALSMAVLLFFNHYFGAQKPPVQVQEPGVTVPGVKTPAAQDVRPAAVPAGVPATARPEKRTVLENEFLTLEVSNRGGTVVGARLKKYGDRPGPDARPVELLSALSGVDFAGGTGLLAASPEVGTVYEGEVGRRRDEVTYRLRVGEEIEIEKTYTLGSERYDVLLAVTVRNRGAAPLRDRLGLVMVRDFGGEEDDYTFTGPMYYGEKGLEEIKIGKLKEGVQETSSVSWTALVDKYFLVAAVPDSPASHSMRVGTHLGMEKAAEVELATPVFEIPPGGSAEFQYRLYLGPKWVETLAPLGHRLEEVVDYGYFDVIAKPLLWFLNAIYSVTGNYGIAIILLTTCVKAVFWPLSAKSFRSMQRMKDLQPKMQRLKEKYGSDRERLNAEMMQLYKTHKVNPLGGCLPMIVQIPFFFALYKILLSSIELRHAPFLLWIQDLAAKDPYYVTPLLMGGSMFLQQKMTPMTGGPEAQMKIMMYGMPIIFTFLFLNFPSGLVIYWLVNNVLSIAQQAMMLRSARVPTG